MNKGCLAFLLVLIFSLAFSQQKGEAILHLSALSDTKLVFNESWTFYPGDDRRYVLISICDNGTGISQRVVDKIFQPFFTTKPSGDGTGLGLSLSYDIITKGHNGGLKVDTKEGEGATFIIELPVS